MSGGHVFRGPDPPIISFRSYDHLTRALWSPPSAGPRLPSSHAEYIGVDVLSRHRLALKRPRVSLFRQNPTGEQTRAVTLSTPVKSLRAYSSGRGMVSRACLTALLCFGGSRKSMGKSNTSSSLGCAAFVSGHLHSRSDGLNRGSRLAPFTIQDGEIPSTYFSYFWVELEDPSRYPDDASTSLQIPIPELERKRSGGLGIADIQPFLRPPLEAQEEAHEWKGVTERMVDEVEESKRTSKVYDLRLEPSGTSSFFTLLIDDVSESSFAPPLQTSTRHTKSSNAISTSLSPGRL